MAGDDDGTDASATDASLSDASVTAELRAVLTATVQTLEQTGARTEALARFQERRSILGIRRGPVLVPVARVWRLGVLLLDATGGLHTIGELTRAVEPGRVTNQSERAELRRDYRRAAFNGAFAEGDTVNFDTEAVDVDPAALRAGTGILALRNGTIAVRWNKQPGDSGLMPLAPYLAERAELLTAPPP